MAFALMGVVGLLSPAYITSLFGISKLPPDMRNEVSAVYGGYGIAVALLLLSSTSTSLSCVFLMPSHKSSFEPCMSLTLRQGMEPHVGASIQRSIAWALFGMAFGRIFSFALDTMYTGPIPWLTLCVELTAGYAIISTTNEVFAQ